MDMKTDMLSTMEQIQKTLDEYNMIQEDVKTITDTYKEACFQWCQANAFACLMEDVMMQMLDPEHRMKMQRLLLSLSLKSIHEKMLETYPWSGEEDEDEEDDDD